MSQVYNAERLLIILKHHMQTGHFIEDLALIKVGVEKGDDNVQIMKVFTIGVIKHALEQHERRPIREPE